VQISGKVAIVTGGSLGIGRACSIALAKSGNHVAIFSRKRKEGLEIVRELKHLSVKALHLETDVSDPNQVKESIATAYRKFKRIDILVNNAGIVTPLRHFYKQTIEDWEKVLRVHLYGAYFMMKEVAPIMIRQKYGRIVNISSTATDHTGSCGRANYVAAKFGIEGLTLTAAKELAQDGITVNAVRPGYTLTPLTKSRGYDFEAIAALIPVKRVGEPEDVARVVDFLTHEDSSFITGQIISVDGGLSLVGEGISRELSLINI
jgi:3-oxoacyl-[acyl-carrier protein] reductase